MSRTSSRLAAAAAALAAAAAIAACGSNSPASSSSSSASGGRATQADIDHMVRFASCMRAHGVPNFPDPTTSPGDFKQAFNSKSPAFASGERSCGYLLPPPPDGQSDTHSQAQIAAALAFARCMRAHGFPRFPDPSSTGDLTHAMLGAAGIDLHQPAVVPAADGCTTVTHGFLTRAMVARFVAGQ